MVDITKKTGFTSIFIEKKISYYNKIELIESQRINDQFINVRLKFMGYDAIALSYLVQGNVINSIGLPIGIGKESNVFEAILEGPESQDCVIKLHKLGKTKFKATRKRRDYLAEKKHSSRLYESTLNAKREVEALKELAGILPVPKVYDNNRHIIVMEKINGVELYKLKLSQDEYKEVFRRLIEYIKIMVGTGIIHGDLSVFNILISIIENKIKVYLIDWPQFLRLNHKNALETFLNDLNNIYTYFSKKTEIPNLDVEVFGTELYNQAVKNLRIRV